jgi:hypothetical protein
MAKLRRKTADHAEGEHGPRTRRAIIKQLESGRTESPAEEVRQKARGPASETGKQRLFENREQHDEAEQQSERRRLEDRGEE